MSTSTLRLPVAALALLLFPLTSTLNAQTGFAARLTAVSDVVLAGTPAELTLSIDVKADTKLPKVLLNGMALATTVDGKAGPKIRKRSSGTVKLLAGTKIVRVLKVDLRQVVPNLAPGTGARVGFAWEGLDGVSTFVELAPDLRTVSIDALDLAKTRVKLVTNLGDMVLKFYPDQAPKTVANFVKLAKDGFYDTTRFHRVMAGFMIQGGCPNSKPGAVGRPGTGSPGYTIKAEFNNIKHVKGVLSMARSNDPDSAGCQFFVMHATNSGLDGKYTAFGELQSGVDTLDKIALARVNGETPVDPVHIKAAIVLPAFKKQDK